MHTLANWLSEARDWLDARGKGAWIATMILAFVFFWPAGLAILFYMIWSKRMGCANRKYRNFSRRARFADTGNTAFDSYREETLKRLEDEQSSFKAFLQRLRDAKDKAEFDEFMNDRDDRAKGNSGDEVPA